MTMDSIAIFWLCSILFSAAGKVVCAFAVLKEAADSGYKFVLDENLLGKFKTSENETKNYMELFMPLYNILSQFYNLITIKNNAGLLVFQLYALGLLEDMTPQEKEEYSKKPGGIKAMMMSVKNKIKKEEEKSVPEKKSKYKDKLSKFKEYLDNSELNVDHCFKINSFEVHYIIVEEEERKKIVFGDYKGDLTKMSDDELDCIMFLKLLDSKSTIEYLEKLKNEKEELKSVKSEKVFNTKQEHINLGDEIVKNEDSLEEKKGNEKKLIKKR